MKQQLSFLLLDLSKDQMAIVMLGLMCICLGVVGAIVISAYHDKKVQRAWIRRCSRSRDRQ